MIELVKFHVGTFRYIAGMIWLSPILLGLKAGWITSHFAKEKLLTHFFKGMDIKLFRQLCRRFFDEKKELLLRDEAVERLRSLRNDGFEIVIVTASAKEWAQFWAVALGTELIATHLEVVDGKVTGKLDGPNCNFSEKVTRIKAQYQLQDYTEIHAYGDSRGDAEMLAIATHPFFRKFH